MRWRPLLFESEGCARTRVAFAGGKSPASSFLSNEFTRSTAKDSGSTAVCVCFAQRFSAWRACELRYGSHMPQKYPENKSYNNNNNNSSSSSSSSCSSSSSSIKRKKDAPPQKKENKTETPHLPL